MRSSTHSPLHVREDGSGPALVLLSANPGDSRDFDGIVPALAQRFRVLRLDWPGYGSSAAPNPPERAGASHFLEVFARWMDEAGIARAHLLGNSVGGNVAVRYALAQPQRVASLVLVSSGGFTAHNPVTRGFCRLQGQLWFKRLLGDRFTRAYLRARNPLTRAMIERAGGEQATDEALRVNAAVWRSFLDPAHDLRESARALTVPTLVTGGRHDPVIPARRDVALAARTIPGAELHIFDTGHAPFAEAPDAFLEHVQAFWNRHGA